MTNTKQLAGGLLATAVVIVVAFFAWNALQAPDNRGAGQRVDDAINELTSSDGRGVGEKLDDAGSQLRDRSGAERVGDGLRDAGRDIKESIEGNK